MLIENIFLQEDIFIILFVIFVTNILKTKIKFVNFYSLYPFFISFFIFCFCLILKIYQVQNWFFILKWWMGSIFFYDIFLDKLKKVNFFNKKNGENDKDI